MFVSKWLNFADIKFWYFWICWLRLFHNIFSCRVGGRDTSEFCFRFRQNYNQTSKFKRCICSNAYGSAKQTLSKILCKWKQDSAVSLFLYLNSVFKNKQKLVHSQSQLWIGIQELLIWCITPDVYLNMDRLVEKMTLSILDGTFLKMIASLEKNDLIMLDNFGLQPMDTDISLVSCILFT